MIAPGTVKELLETTLNFTEIGAKIGVSRERVRQIAKKSFGITGRDRHKIKAIHTARKIIDPRKPCPRCGYRFAQKRGPSKLGASRMLCVCGKSFIAGDHKRQAIVRPSEYYRQIGKLSAIARWGSAGPLTLNYPYMPTVIEDRNGGDLVSLVNGIVPHGLYDHCRADVCQDILLAILEGKLKKEDLSKHTVTTFITRWFRQGGREVSLNAPRYGGDKTLGEVLGVC